MSDLAHSAAIDLLCVQDALRGDVGAVERLVMVLQPVVQKRVARAVLKRWQLRSRDVRQEVQDLTHDVFVTLLANDGAILRKWNPSLGRSLPNFVAWQAERIVSSHVRGRGWSQESLAEDPDREHVSAASERTHEQLLTRDLLRRLYERLTKTLSPRGREMFQRLFILEQSVPEICERMDLKPEDVYQWRHQLKALARQGLSVLQGETCSGLDD